ncbi:hypothetical protein G9A89_003765 [Geosiphon pyriformis]|nr:hypothetical protein G9A89_003765 [Geosiphon pyriformis]
MYIIAGVSGSGLTGLKTQLSTKKKCVDSIYFCDASYKKPKKPVANDIVDLSAGSLSLVDISGVNSKPVVFWGSKVGSIESSINSFFDLKNIKNMVAEKTSYTDLDDFVNNENMIANFSSSSSKILTIKMDELESKMVALEVLVELVLERLDCLCSDLGSSAPLIS